MTTTDTPLTDKERHAMSRVLVLISDALDLGLEQIRQLLEVVAARGGR